MSGTAIPQALPQALRLGLIRDFEVQCGGRPVNVLPASQRLVSFLAFQVKPVRRGYVSGTLWFDSDEQHASASLRSALWRLHPLELVNSSATHLWLAPTVEVDLHRVTALAVSILRDSLPDEALLAVAQELIDVGDELLTGWYDDWVIVERERFRQLRLHALDQMGERFIKEGRLYDALQVGLAATSAEPLRESAHRLLVRVHLMQGNIAEAVRQYKLYANLLRSEMNGRPSQAMRNLLVPFIGSASGDTARAS